MKKIATVVSKKFVRNFVSGIANCLFFWLMHIFFGNKLVINFRLRSA